MFDRSGKPGRQSPQLAERPLTWASGAPYYGSCLALLAAMVRLSVALSPRRGKKRGPTPPKVRGPLGAGMPAGFPDLSNMPQGLDELPPAWPTSICPS